MMSKNRDNKNLRTPKEFTDYNDYRDRVFGLKWGTAFSLAELTQVIHDGKKSDLNVIKELPLMTREEIDVVLQLAFLKSKSISIQYNDRDDKGNLRKSITGAFRGISDEEFLYLDDGYIPWESIRNVKILK